MTTVVLQSEVQQPGTRHSPNNSHNHQRGGQNDRSYVDHPPNIAVDVTHLEDIARNYIVSQLRENRYTWLADRCPPVRDPNHNVHRLIGSICTQLERERGEQFDDIISSLTVTDDNLEDTYRQLMSQVFNDGVNWGKIITFLVFSARLSLYCAQHELQDRVLDIVEWTQDEMRERIHSWVQERGGWAAFVQHYDNDSWKMSLSSFIVVTGMVAAVVAGGVFMVKRFLF